MSETLEVIFLGTGGGVPSPRRFLPAVALRRGRDWFLFDAGEGVQIRLQQSPLGWGGLKAVFISHLHGDHVLGLPGLLMSLGMARRQEPLPVYGPPGIDEYLRCSLDLCQVALPFETRFHAIPQNGGALLTERDFQVTAAPLRHRTLCYGFFLHEEQRTGRFFPERAAELGIPPGSLYGRLQAGETVLLPDGREITPDQVLGPPRPGRLVAYCTDTAPCRAVVTHARGADLLIHDATFAADLEEEARISGHSTTVQAAEQARAARCLRLALTHLSVRYEDSRPLLEEAAAIFPNTLVASDLLVIPIPPRES